MLSEAYRDGNTHFSIYTRNNKTYVTTKTLENIK